MTSDNDANFVQIMRARQRREAARGCLLALLLESAALLAGALWVAAKAFGLPRLTDAATFGFVAFTVAAMIVGVVLLIQGNLPRHRRLRKAATTMLAEEDSAAPNPGSVAKDPEMF